MYTQTSIDEKALCLYGNLKREFESRIHSKVGLNGTKLNIEISDNTIWATFFNGESKHSFHIPIPYIEDGIVLITQNGVKRAVCRYFIEETQRVLDYTDIIHKIIFGHPVGIIPDFLIKKIDYFQQIIFSFENNITHVAIHNMQRAISEVVNRMPLHTTKMNSWAMNNRLIIIDPKFEELVDPKERLEYQIDKARKHFNKGWTSMGLSDGVLADHNYILTVDLRDTIPFGRKFHNPQRNLYSTLSMRGKEEPLVLSETMYNLQSKGIYRGGWNLFTAFIDIPDVWEDQIVVDSRLASKFTKGTKRYQCFGQLKVKTGIKLNYGKVLSVSEDGKPKIFRLTADKSWVHKITKGKMNVGATETEVYNVIVKYKRNFKDAVKITNHAANKGVIKLVDNLGVAKDPRTGKEVRIDVIVSSKSVKKRKNYTQILEALINNISGNKTTIIPDNYSISSEELESRLVQNGFPKDGTWECNTYATKGKAICGKVFWGVTANPEKHLWDKNDTVIRNGRELRTAGLKFSSIEFRSITTRFGKDNPIIAEILSYAQGTEDIHEKIKVLRSKLGILPKDVPIINNAIEVDQSTGLIVEKEQIIGTIADEDFFTNGFVLELPVDYQVAVSNLDDDCEVVSEGIPRIFTRSEIETLDLKISTFNKIYIPSSNLRKCWRHEVGKYGLSAVGTLVNNIVAIANRFKREEDSNDLMLLYQALYTYFSKIALSMGTKRGELSTYGMSVRYPFSSKATATLSNNLPSNTVEIHRNMAEEIMVLNGDIVLVERFPCLGFMSLVPQKVKITDDPNCKYTIRVSGCDLRSTALDFDGDNIYLASFHTKASKELLKKEWESPDKECYEQIVKLNLLKGIPHFSTLTLNDYGIKPFDDLTSEEHAACVAKATGVKSHTGPVIALAYNIMRIIENSEVRYDHKVNVGVEIFLDIVANSVFKQKHGVKSLHDIVIDAICSADVDALVSEGFDKDISQTICNVIISKAKSIGVKNLPSYHKFIKEKKRSNIINRIVRIQNKIYFASRATLEGCQLLSYLSSPKVDIPSKTLHWVLSGKAHPATSELDIRMEEGTSGVIRDEEIREACKDICKYIDKFMTAGISE